MTRINNIANVAGDGLISFLGKNFLSNFIDILSEDRKQKSDVR